MILVLALLGTGPAQAGSRWLINDGFVDGASAGFQGGFISGECWGSIYVPSADEYPFTLEKVRALVGGSSSSEYFTIEFFNFSGTNFESSGLLGAEEVYLRGSNTAWNEITISELKLGLAPITEGNVGIAMCLEKQSGFPAIARDTDGMAYASRNYIYADAGAGWQWYTSNLFGVTGDWIMRLCIAGDGVADEGCTDSGTTGGTTGGTTTGGTTTGGDTGVAGDTGLIPDGGSTGGTQAGTLAIDSVTPTTAAQGQAVDIVVLGQGFSDTAEARIGGIAIVGNDVLSDTTIQGRTPTTLPVGVHDVEVVDGGDSVVLAGAFEVTAGGCGCASGGGSASGAGLFAMLLGLVGIGRRRRLRLP